MQLIATFPMIAAYAYHAYNHYEKDQSMYIHRPEKELSIAENFLRMLRPDTCFTDLEARVLDIALLLHMEHGGGNNSTFTTRVVTSSGSDTYSVIAAAMSSLKGKKHGGANLMVMNMMDDIKEHVKDYADEEEIAAYLDKLLNKQAFDKKVLYMVWDMQYILSQTQERKCLRDSWSSLQQIRGAMKICFYIIILKKLHQGLLQNREKYIRE